MKVKVSNKILLEALQHVMSKQSVGMFDGTIGEVRAYTPMGREFPVARLELDVVARLPEPPKEIQIATGNGGFLRLASSDGVAV